MALFDTLKSLGSNILSKTKELLGMGGGKASLEVFAPFGLQPTLTQQKAIQTIPQLSEPVRPGEPIQAIGETPGGIRFQQISPTTRKIIPETDRFVPTVRPLITTQPTQPQAIPTTPAPTPTPTPTPTGFATGEPTIIAQPALAGVSTPSGLSTPSAPSAPSGAASGFFAGFSPSYLRSFTQSLGIQANRINPQTGEILNPTEEEKQRFKQFKEPKPKAIDVTQIQAEPFKVSPTGEPISAEVLSQKAAELYKTAQDYQQNLQTQTNQAYASAPPTPAQPVVETLEQAEAVRNSTDPFGLQAAMDASRVKNGIPELENQRIETMKNIQALNVGLAEIVRRIEEVPGVPKAIKENQLRNFIKANAPFLDQLNGTLQIINTQIDQANEAVNREFGIRKLGVEQQISEQQKQQQQQEQERDNARQQVQQYISSGAFAEFTDDQLKQIDNAKVGYDFAGLKTMRDALKSGNEAKIANAQAKLDIQEERLRLAQEKAAGGGTGTQDQPLTINQIDQFRRSYGWTPPFGFTQTQLLQFMKDNPTATPEELEAGAKRAAASGSDQTTQAPTTERNTIGGVTERIKTAKDTGYSNEEIKATIKGSYSTEELFALAKAAGYTKWYTGDETDINRMLDALMK